MTNNPNVALRRGVRELIDIANRVDRLDRMAQRSLKDIWPLLKGTRCRRFGKVYQIASAHTHRGHVHVAGVRVTMRGSRTNVGKRQFDLGALHHCKFED